MERTLKAPLRIRTLQRPLDLLSSRQQLRQFGIPRARADALRQSQQHVCRLLTPRRAGIQPREEEARAVAYLILRPREHRALVTAPVSFSRQV